MMVTFVSECEKKALVKTRRVLDAFANRIGSRTWQTVITADGLLAVKRLLRKTASKNAAVSCHWIRSRSRSELMWVVGNRRKFNTEGIVPVNFTDVDIGKYKDKTEWKTLKLIKYAAAIAGLFHDFGKANNLFQKKINPNVVSARFEPYRHEWVSLRLFQAFVDKKSDNDWLVKLADVYPETVADCFRDGLDGSVNSKNHPILSLPPFARLVAWIIVSHHRLPIVPGWDKKLNVSADFTNIDEWFADNFCAVWNSYRCEEKEQQERITENWAFARNSLPYCSSHWRAKACVLASDAREALSLWLDLADHDFINDYLFTSHLSRLSMMLADHHYSAQLHVSPKWRNPSYKVYANSDRKTKKLKQQLDEHLIGVAHHAECIVTKLPELKNSLAGLSDASFLIEPVPKKFKQNFGWQDKTIKAIEKVAGETKRQGFFGINMASTGKGKTIANAKIMYALGNATGGVRFSVALGLRTLTLQTGREFRDSVELTDEQLAVLVGGTAVKQLYENAQTDGNSASLDVSGSESDQEILQEELFVHYSGAIAEHSLSKWTNSNSRLDKLLCAPVLVSTIDHLIPATEGTRGGQQIGPMLRLLTSDLVLDEPDDFGLEDLPALSRLVHWAGMLGSRVLLSTATMPPALSYALFQAYRAGWSQYAKANVDDWRGEISCAWFDEKIKPLTITTGDFKTFQTQHKKFVANRLKALGENTNKKRLGEIATIEGNGGNPDQAIAKTLFTKLNQLHQNHHVSNGKQQVSIGLIRMANINPLVAVARKLVSMSATEDSCIHYCIYHSRYPLAIRSYIEERLDKVLKRKVPEEFWQHEEINDALQKHPEIKNHIFVVLASPVAEVGRDHDYDWAIVEPSSMRSIIQLAGRVLRHRKAAKSNENPNIVLFDNNFKALKNETVCFNRPGFESRQLRVKPHDLSHVLEQGQYQAITAAPRIKEPQKITGESIKRGDQVTVSFSKLNDLEHSALKAQLFSNIKSANVWWKHQPYWCGEVQRQQPFRQSNTDEAYYLCVDDEYGKAYWQWLNENVYPPELGELTDISIQPVENLITGKNCSFWFQSDALSVYSQLAKDFGIDLPEVSNRFGELRITNYQRNECTEYYYHQALGVFQEIDEK